MQYDDSAISSETGLKLYYWDSSLKQWVEVCTADQVCQHDVEANQFTIEIDHLTEFALLVATHKQYLPVVLKQ